MLALGAAPSGNMSMNKEELSEIKLVDQMTLLIPRKLSLMVICFILLNFHFKQHKETLSVTCQH